ncbi:MAG: tRNA1(Val) (adenine(37)-N6)-methyltransferase [Crocinitomicaceae bacterium]
MSFKFKQFEVEQKVNAHKVGTDSMILGAWVNSNFMNALDIGTGTGILALMLAQKNPQAIITGIEPNPESCIEAALNFKNSSFSNRLSAINSSLQDFNSNQLFDCIICNPPYFVDSTLSDDSTKNSARHTIDLGVKDLYKNVANQLSDSGQFSIVFPSNLLESHLQSASDNGLFPYQILIIENDQKEAIRHLVSFKKEITSILEERMIVKYSNGLYSKSYVELTKDFHNRALPFQKL